MIQANELRIGNWVISYPSQQIEQVYDLMCDCINTKTKERLPLDCIDSIPLTPEILEKCGFVNLNYGWTKGDFCLFDFNYGKGNLNLRLNAAECPLPIVKHLHQLQNLYWCLCGKELEINLQ